jgi:hypothetical protein
VVFFTLKGEAIARAMQQPSDRVTVVSIVQRRLRTINPVEGGPSLWPPTGRCVARRRCQVVLPTLEVSYPTCSGS